MQRSVGEVSRFLFDQPSDCAEIAISLLVMGFRLPSASCFFLIIFWAMTKDKLLYTTVVACYSSKVCSIEVGSLARLALP
jgi:hypothetical protein